MKKFWVVGYNEEHDELFYDVVMAEDELGAKKKVDGIRLDAKAICALGITELCDVLVLLARLTPEGVESDWLRTTESILGHDVPQVAA